MHERGSDLDLGFPFVYVQSEIWYDFLCTEGGEIWLEYEMFAVVNPIILSSRIPHHLRPWATVKSASAVAAAAAAAASDMQSCPSCLDWQMPHYQVTIFLEKRAGCWDFLPLPLQTSVPWPATAATVLFLVWLILTLTAAAGSGHCTSARPAGTGLAPGSRTFCPCRREWCLLAAHSLTAGWERNTAVAAPSPAGGAQELAGAVPWLAAGWATASLAGVAAATGVAAVAAAAKASDACAQGWRRVGVPTWEKTDVVDRFPTKLCSGLPLDSALTARTLELATNSSVSSWYYQGDPAAWSIGRRRRWLSFLGMSVM